MKMTSNTGSLPEMVCLPIKLQRKQKRLNIRITYDTKIITWITKMIMQILHGLRSQYHQACPLICFSLHKCNKHDLVQLVL